MIGVSLHSLIIDEEGSLWSTGNNAYGQLGLGEKNFHRTLFTRVDHPTIILNVSAGDSHSAFVDSEGRLWTFGWNSKGQLGHGDTNDRWTPTVVERLLPSTLGSVHCGLCGNFTIALDWEGRVWSFGDNSKGQLGLGDTQPRSSPEQIALNRLGVDGSPRWISCGGEHVLIVDQQGNVWAMGSNSHGQLGLGETESRLIPTKIESLSNINRISCGSYYSVCVDYEGDVWIFGSNSSGQLGVEQAWMNTPKKHPTLKNIQWVSCGRYSTFVKSIEGDIFAFGYNYYGNLGLGHAENLPSKNIQSIYSSHHTYFVDSEGSIWAVGRNSFGQIGVGDTLNRMKLTEVKGLKVKGEQPAWMKKKALFEPIHIEEEDYLGDC